MGTLHKIRANKDLIMLQKETPLSEMKKAVQREFRNRVKISDAWKQNEQQDVDEEKHIKADKNLSQLQLSKTNPEKALMNRIARERQSLPKIQDSFSAQEKVDAKQEKRIKSDKNMNAFLAKDFHWDFDSKDDESSSGKQVSTSDDSTPAAQSAIDRYVSEFASTQAKAEAELKPQDFSQNVVHTEESTGNVISIPLSSQLQTQASLIQTGAKIAPNVEQKVKEER